MFTSLITDLRLVISNHIKEIQASSEANVCEDLGKVETVLDTIEVVIKDLRAQLDLASQELGCTQTGKTA